MATHSSRLRLAGLTYGNFRVTQAIPIPELQCFLREIIHEPTGAQVMHIETDDPENLFCLSFQTLPYNSNGVAHILEHTVLCGSRKYPVKDPFFAMNRRSLNTFMNALTGADFTCYPAASQITQDFYNLLEVYLDAVFHPLLNKYSFLQEGCRLEFSVPEDPKTPLEYKGIVYNEMKGALSPPSARLSEAINESLFPDILYGYNSGGDPKIIPTLTYEEFKNFYHTYYHPSRCLFFFYGNMPIEKHLDFIEEKTLRHTKPSPPLPPIPLQPRFKKGVYRELFYPIPPEEDLQDKTLLAFAWLTCHILEQEEVLALSVLEIILMDTDASPLKMALLQSGLCKQASSFIDTELHEVPWGITLKGCQPEQADTLEAIIRETLESICEKGIPMQMIDNAIHQFEFHRTEITGDQAPFGLSLFIRCGLLKQHGAEAVQGLKIHSLFDQLRKHILLDPLYFSLLIKKYLLNNTHFVRIVMQPDPQLGQKEIHWEKEQLRKIQASLSSKEQQHTVKQSLGLEEFQKKQENEDVNILPKLSIKDIPLSPKNYPLTQEKIGIFTAFHRTIFTNDILYADLIFQLPDLTQKELVYLRLFTVIMTQLGSTEHTYQEILEAIQGNTGGIGAGISLHLQAENSSLFFPTFNLRGKALRRKGPKLFSLLYEIASSIDLNDPKRMKEIVSKHFVTLESRVNQSALRYAINVSASKLNVASKVANDLYGLPYYWEIREFMKNFDEEWPEILLNLEAIQNKITCLENPHIVLSCDAASYEECKEKGFYELGKMKTKPYEQWKGNFSVESLVPQGRVIASPVAFMGKVFPTVPYTHAAAPALYLASHLFDNLTLHPKIREQGGAYGGGAVSNPLSANFYFYSYRDPHIVSTLEAFEEAVDNVAQGNFDNEHIEEAKFEVAQTLGSPDSPGSQGDVAYGWLAEGRTLEIRQRFRNQMLATSREEVIEAVTNIIAKQMSKGTEVVFASKEQLDKANQQLVSNGKNPLSIEYV